MRGTTLGLLTVISMIAFEAMAVGPALPTAARQLHGLGLYGAAFTAFLVANVVGMVLAGQVADARGPRDPLLAGAALFLAGLLVAGTAPVMAQLVAARAVQGLGGGLLITAGYVLIGETYDEALRPRVFTAISSAWLVPSLLGPVVSGTVTQHLGWRWVFLGLVPLTAAGTVLLLPVLRRLPARVDATGRGARAVLTAPHRLGLALVVAVGVALVDAAGQRSSASAVPLGLAGLVVVVAAVRGLVPPGTFRARPGVAAPVALRALLAGSMFGAESVLPLMLSQQHRLGATLSGLPLAGAGVLWAHGSWVQSRAVPGGPAAVSRRRVGLVRTGLACIAGGIAVVGVASFPAVPWWITFPGWALAGLGAGLSMSTIGVLLLAATTDADRGRDSAALQLADTTASALTTGLAGVLVAAAVRETLGYTAAFAGLDAVMLLVALVGVLAAGRARSSALAATP